MKQPEALRLAENLEKWNYATSYQGQAAAELRRLHEANQAMLEALKEITLEHGMTDKARAAIAKGEQQ